MPRISDQFSDCVIYVYASLEDAKVGERSGGSGFIVAVELPNHPGEASEAYFVTNRHVIANRPTPVVRINRKDRTVEYFETKREDWFFHPSGDDIALVPFQPISVDDLSIRAIYPKEFLTFALAIKHDVGIGDDCFMTGRFINHEGKQQNVPALRFGNIAMMPGETILTEWFHPQETFLVEIKSLPGYSGSPVFLYSVSADRDFSQRHLEEEEEEMRKETAMRTGNQNPLLDSSWTVHLSPKGPFLLGIDSCHLQTVEKVRDKDGKPHPDGWTVSTNSGMAGVIPAWKINELLNCEELIQMRKKVDDEVSELKRSSSVSFDDAESEEKDFTADDFVAALKKVGRKSYEPASTSKRT